MKYRIEADARSWMLCEHSVTGDNNKKLAAGTVVWKPFRYYGTLEQAAVGLLRQLMIDGVGVGEDATNAQVVAQVCVEAEQRVLEAVRDLERRGIDASPQRAQEPLTRDEQIQETMDRR